jgi:YD repeat-containing protein
MKCLAIIFFNGILFQLQAQVNLHNGQVEYELPLYAFNDEKSGLATNVSLCYSSGGGLLVDDQAECTGQNWSLVAGGSIVRRQNGEPDDQYSLDKYPAVPVGNINHHNVSIATWNEGTTEAHDYMENYFPNGYMYSEFPLDLSEEEYSARYAAPRELGFDPRFRYSMDKRWKQSRRALADRQQDVFMYEFNGRAGEFVIGKDGKVSLVNQCSLRIAYNTAPVGVKGIRTRINSFSITDETGIQYFFSAMELACVTRIERKPYSGSIFIDGFPDMDTIINEPTGEYVAQKWLLTQVRNVAGNETINFEYKEVETKTLPETLPFYEYTEGQNVDDVNIYLHAGWGKTKQLSSISLPAGYKLLFNYEPANERVDVPGDPPLTSFSVTLHGKEISTHRFTYGYFLKKNIVSYNYEFSEKEKRFARLCLLSFQKSAKNLNEPPYEFSYYTGNEFSESNAMVPPTGCLYQDHWGFYNAGTLIDMEKQDPGKTAIKNLLMNVDDCREPREKFAELGILATIKTPLGGMIHFEYGQNESEDPSQAGVSRKYGGIRVEKMIVTDGGYSSKDLITGYAYVNENGNSSGWGYEPIVYGQVRELKIVKDPDGYKSGGQSVGESASSLSRFFIKSFVNKLTTIAVKTLVSAAIKDGAMAPLIGVNPLTAAIAYVIGGLIDRIFILFDPYDYTRLHEYGYYPLGAHNPLGLHYGRVEVSNLSPGVTNGKTVYEFTKPVDRLGEIPPLHFPYSARQRFPAWKYDLPLKTSFFNNEEKLVREISNQYEVFNSPLENEANRSCKIEPWRITSGVCEMQTQSIPLSNFSAEFYYPITGRTEKISSTIKEFGHNTQSISTETFAMNAYHQPAIVTRMKSNGDVETRKTYYATDYENLSPAIAQMKIKNCISLPLSSETWLLKPNGDEYLIEGLVNEYLQLPSGEIKIQAVYKLEISKPLPLAVIGRQDPSRLMRNPGYFKEQLRYNYDAAGYLVSVTTTGHRVQSKYFDYENRIATATIVNAAVSDIAYTSFETLQDGNWKFDQQKVVSEEAVTGTHAFCFPSEGAAISREIPKSGNFLLSFWAKKGAPFVILNNSPSGLQPAIVAKNTKTGWTFYTYKFAGPCNLTIDNTSLHVLERKLFFLDELRLYPADARMSTACYDEQYQKTEECDVNNHILHFYYDAFRRLCRVADEKFNTVKTFEYHLQQQH